MPRNERTSARVASITGRWPAMRRQLLAMIKDIGSVMGSANPSSRPPQGQRQEADQWPQSAMMA